MAIPFSEDHIQAPRLLWKALATHNAKTLNIAGNNLHRLAGNGWPKWRLNAWLYLVIAKVHEH